jgi:hypothetical protein
MINTHQQRYPDESPRLIALWALARRIQQLRAEIAEHDQALADLVTRVNPALLQAKGIGVSRPPTY